MLESKNNTKSIISVLILLILMVSVFLPLSQAIDVAHIRGFDKGLSYTSVIPMKKTIFVNFDSEKLIDDYSYLAAVPTAVFNDNGNLYSYPLLYYQDEYEYEEDKMRSLNAYQGLDYFMQDWSEVCNNRFDETTLINVEKNKVDHWGNSKTYTKIEADNPFDIANEIALNDWSFSDSAVIAVIQEEYEKPYEITRSEVSGTIPSYKTEKKNIEIRTPCYWDWLHL